MLSKLFSVAALAVLALSAGARAQDFGAAFSGFDTGSNNPIQIEADRLEVRDPDKLAIYSGHVRVRQGETVLEAPEMRIFYAGQGLAAGVPGLGGASGKASASGAPKASGTASTPGAVGASVSRIEAGPGVSVRSGDRTATGDRAVLDMAKNLVTLEGNVVLTQGSSVVRGDRLIVNLATKVGRVEGGRVQTLITPADAKAKPVSGAP